MNFQFRLEHLFLKKLDPTSSSLLHTFVTSADGDKLNEVSSSPALWVQAFYVRMWFVRCVCVCVCMCVCVRVCVVCWEANIKTKRRNLICLPALRWLAWPWLTLVRGLPHTPACAHRCWASEGALLTQPAAVHLCVRVCVCLCVMRSEILSIREREIVRMSGWVRDS